jgi:hypothetical protein
MILVQREYHAGYPVGGQATSNLPQAGAQRSAGGLTYRQPYSTVAMSLPMMRRFSALTICWARISLMSVW